MALLTLKLNKADCVKTALLTQVRELYYPFTYIRLSSLDPPILHLLMVPTLVSPLYPRAYQANALVRVPLKLSTEFA
jgi:hypothetical protein